MALVMSQVSSTHSHVSWPKVRTACVASKGSYIKLLERVNRAWEIAWGAIVAQRTGLNETASWCLHSVAPADHEKRAYRTAEKRVWS